MRKLAAITAVAVLVPAAAAQADTKQVSVGPKKPLKGLGPAAFNADFFPNRVTIAKGDHVRFVAGTGFGDVAFVPKGEAVPPFALPVAEQPITGAKDAAGADMWFNGRPNVVPNLPALTPTGGNVINGKKLVSSGLSMDGPMKPWKVKFTKSGRYTMTSVFHPATTMTVVVKNKDAGVPGRKVHERAIRKQTRALSRKAKRLAELEALPGNRVRAGNDADGTAQIAFFPTTKTIQAGETVTFEMSKESIEIHNVAIGPLDYLNHQAKRFFGPVFDPFVVYRSQPPGVALVADDTVHGNGFVNTGVLDTDDTSPYPAREKVTFTEPGTYDYYCVIHGNAMKGEIVVEG